MRAESIYIFGQALRYCDAEADIFNVKDRRERDGGAKTSLELNGTFTLGNEGVQKGF